jgi:hypothetical protein
VKNPVFVLLPALLLSGCLSVERTMMSDKPFPSHLKYEILGEVSVSKKRVNVLGAVWWGPLDWLDLHREAVRKFGNAVDDVVNASAKTEINGIGALFTWQRITMSGTAVRYITPEEPPAGIGPGTPLRTPETL